MKVKLGLKNVVYSKVTITDGVDPTFGTVKSWPGAVNLNLEVQGENYSFWADDGPYYERNGNAGYSGDLESALVPDDFKLNHLGYYEDVNGSIIEDPDLDGDPFALGYIISGDRDNRPVWLYNCIASRPASGGGTKTENTEVKTETCTITARPVDFPSLNRRAAKGYPGPNTTAAYKASYLDQVTPPAAAKAQGNAPAGGNG
jgi:phi13 family phage major tail protein